MAQEIDFAAPEIKSLETWLRRALSESGGQAAAELGCTLDIDIQSLALKTEDEIRPDVPGNGFSWGLKVPEEEGHLFVLFGRKIALSFTRPADDAEGALSERLADEASFSDEEKEAIQKAQGVLSQSLIAAIESDSSAESMDANSDLIEESTWASGHDPVGPGTMLVAEINTTHGNGESEAGLVLFSPGLARAHFESALTAPQVGSGGTAGAGNFLFYPASSSMKAHILSQLDSTPQECETVAELMRGFVDTETSGVVVGVNHGEEHILSLLRGMKELPECRDKTIVIVLENPSTANVVRCGRLGLFSVLPKEFAASDLILKLSRPE